MKQMRVAIAGYGLEGEINLLYWRALGADIKVFDEKQPERIVPEGVETYFGSDAFSQMEGFDLVIRTAGLNPNKIKTNGKIWSATNEFFAKCPAPIIGVTGTKGKGTTCSLIAEILKAAGKTVHLVGNIGVPALERLSKIAPDDIVVYELSSFQLWDLEKSPSTAVVLMIEPDHMDVHASMEEYVNAKANIVKYQTEEDQVIYHLTNPYSAQIAEKSAGVKIKYMSDSGAYIKNDEIVVEGITICKTSEVGLIGNHNLENICAAVTTAWRYTQDTSAIKIGITTFKGLPHRLEYAGEVDAVKFYDDSQATGVGSVLAALRSFNSPTTIILGGSDKGVDVSAVIEELDPSKHAVVLIGQVSEKLEQKLKDRSFNNYVNLGTNTNMPEIVEEALKLTQPGGVVLLSPAHASFGMFKNYQDRGDQFKKVVKALKS